MARQPHPQRVLKSYSSVAIVGIGLIGGSLAVSLRRLKYPGRILGVSSDATIKEALRLGVIDEGFGYTQLIDAVKDTDLVVFAGPISVILEQIEAVGKCGEQLRSGLVLTDVGSTKREIVRAADDHLPTHVKFVGGHPLAGSERTGLSAADPFLFQNAYYVLTPSESAGAEDARRLGDFLSALGAHIVVLDALSHDRIAAAISHVPQLLAVALVRSLDSLGEHSEHALRLAAGGFRDMTRIASSPFPVWRDIISTNRDMIASLLGDFFAQTESELGDLQTEQLEAAFEAAAQLRSTIPSDTKGFLTRLWDVLVVVEDRPGVIVDVCSPLAGRGINVQDIEVLKVREGEGGTLRLAFRTREVAESAVGVLTQKGFTARLRE